MQNQSKKNIWILSSNRWNSAATEYILQSARALISLGHNVVLSPLEHSPALQRALNYRIECLPFRDFSLTQIFLIRRLAKRIKPSLIICAHGPEFILGQFLSCPRIRLALDARKDTTRFPWASFVVTPSKKIACSRKLKFIPLATDESRFFPQEGIRKEFDLMVVGRLDPVKGHARAFSILRKIPNPPSLCIVGEESQLSVAELKSSKEGLPVTFISERVSDIENLMQSTRFGWVPSLSSEKICRVAQEFLMCGVPVIVSNAGSLPEVVETSDDGLVYDLSSSDMQIAKSLEEQLGKKNMEPSQNRHDRALRRFSMRQVAEYWRIYLGTFRVD